MSFPILTSPHVFLENIWAFKFFTVSTNRATSTVAPSLNFDIASKSFFDDGKLKTIFWPSFISVGVKPCKINQAEV